jgi:uncharacterized protein with von Willebrand factor type A (vWA) domain
MIGALARFADALRAHGHPVSPAEMIDASRALDLVGLERRSDVRAALRATLAKDRRAAAAFDRVFDTFFVPPAREGKGTGAGRAGAAGERPQAGGGERPGPARRKPEEERPARRPAAEPTRDAFDRRRDGSRAHDESAPRVARARALEQLRRDGERRDGRLRRARLRPASETPADPRHRDLARRMTTEEERAVAREVPRVLRELRLRLGRRLVRARAGRPWIRQAVRENLASGGVPFVIPHRAPKRRSTRVVLLVDVSFSAARASGLFLIMAAEFLQLGRRARVLAFVDKPVDATAAIARWARARVGRGDAGDRRAPRVAAKHRGVRPGAGIARGGVAFADVLDGLADLNLEAPSDYGRAFHALLTSRGRPRGRDTVLVVLGDGRTNRYDPLPWALADIARGCRAVIWLVPEPVSRWGTADSALPAFLPSVDVVAETTDLEGLARGLAELVRRL